MATYPHALQALPAASDAMAGVASMDIRTSIRPTVAEVDLGAIRRNLERLRAAVGKTVAVYGVVKADAYGHGAVAIGRALAPVCDALAVSLVEEGLELRAAGIGCPILVLGAYFGRDHSEVLDERLTPVVYDPADFDRFSAAAARRGIRAAVHVKIETGMNRLGVAVSELGAALDHAAALPALEVTGLCTHFPSADMAEALPTSEAMRRFGECLAAARRRGFNHIVAHAANSAACVRFPGARLDAVRPGLALYGMMPSPVAVLPGLEPALRLTTRIMVLHDVPPGATVSYGGLWRAERPSRIATLPIGYADGYPRHVRNASVLVRGRRVPVTGAVCMDMMMVDVTDVPGATLGDAVALVGTDGPERITVDDLAVWAGTVSYDVLCGLSKRVPRHYRDGEPAAAETAGERGRK